METARSIALKQMAANIPVADARVAQGMQQARLMGLQSAVASTTAPATKSDIQQAGAQQAAQAGGIATKAAAQTTEQMGALGKVGIQEQQNAATRTATQARTSLDNLNRTNTTELAALGRDLKQDIFDRRMQFQHDESGRAVLNDSQLADWAVLKSQNQQEFQAKMQDMQLASEREMQLLEVAHKRIVQEMENASKSKIIDQNGASLERLAEAKAAIEARIQREAARARDRIAAWTAGGTVVGAVAGGILTRTPQGAAAGGALGGGVGTLAGSQVEQANQRNTPTQSGSGADVQRPT